ncbi:GNAT family N-acetyltransferase [Lichenifustis flavocetrariae]|uniref:GNAT family N-acetyltransferase n=1 Tax=Lichenifustis flavocetrariae TaxID=2949735 RepID=A0AA41YVF5_9HYPH|nr:GNAT family N-acetyltransferase [Lichenifustis flavocetrariae]MCW6509329.1 GNAT family N-acetyltransferase [Lichenifustis flavocetrariae]
MLPGDVPVLAALFVASIEELTEDDYSPAQQAAWAASADDEPAFAARLNGLLTIVATLDGELVGFAALKAPDHVDMLYVRPDAAGRGIGTSLCEALEKIGQGRGAKAFTVDASDTAQPFFAKRGYASVRRETVSLGDEWLGRTAMRKTLAPTDETRH